MKRTYLTPTIEWHRIDTEPLLITVSAGDTLPPLTPDDGDGDASEALVKSGSDQAEWDW